MRHRRSHAGLDRAAAPQHIGRMHRLFVGVRPPEPIRDLLIDAMDDSADFRWQTEDQLHLTLRFVGEVERPTAEDLADALARVRSEKLELRIAGTGRFEQRNSGALWAGVEQKPPSPPRSSASANPSVCRPSAAPSTRTSPSPAGRAAGAAKSTTSSTAPAVSPPRRSPPTSSSCSRASCLATARIMMRSSDTRSVNCFSSFLNRRKVSFPAGGRSREQFRDFTE